MNRKLNIPGCRLPYSVALLALVAGASRGLGQSIYLDQTEPMLTIPRVEYFDLDVEAERVNYRSPNGGGSSETEQIYIAPGVGIGWDYFLYHPDLLSYSILAEPGYSWEQFGSPGAMSTQDSLLLNGNLNATLLQLKPYSTTFNYNRSHDEYQYNFFNSATVDAQTFGVATGYRSGPVPVTADFTHSGRDSSGLNFNTTSEQNTLDFRAVNSRHGQDVTELDYQFSQFDSTSGDAAQNYTDSSILHHLSLTDSEYFSQSSLASSLYYDHVENEGAPSDNVNLSLDYSRIHTPHLHSFYDYSFALYSAGGSESRNHFARAGLQHQLYESLTSTLDVHGAVANNSSPSSQVNQYNLGTTASEIYSKRLGDWGHLSLSDTATYNLHDAGQLRHGAAHPERIPRRAPEPRLLPGPAARGFFPKLTDATGTITYVQGSDYDIITTSDPWQIRIYTTGPNNLTQGQTVVAFYTIQPNPSGNYSTFNNNAEFRLDFWQHHAGIYARYYYNENRASSSAFVLENIPEFQAGTDLNWHRLRFDADYTDHHSSLYDYQSFTLAESLPCWQPRRIPLGINLHQQWSWYPANGGTNGTQTVTYYSFTGNYNWHPVAGLTWNNEAGYERQHGTGLDQNFIVARSYLTWFVGKLDLHLGYEYQNQEYGLETRERNFVFLRVRRNF